MTLIEALKSGKKFRNPDFPKDTWFLPTQHIFGSEDVLRDDWEIQEEKVEVTRSQVEDAMRKWGGRTLGTVKEVTDFLLKELGFKP